MRHSRSALIGFIGAGDRNRWRDCARDRAQSFHSEGMTGIPY